LKFEDLLPYLLISRTCSVVSRELSGPDLKEKDIHLFMNLEDRADQILSNKPGLRKFLDPCITVVVPLNEVQVPGLGNTLNCMQGVVPFHNHPIGGPGAGQYENIIRTNN
jgi:hypothetical protein